MEVTFHSFWYDWYFPQKLGVFCSFFIKPDRNYIGTLSTITA